jgi:sugar lactone lactonase YvrE
MNFRVQELDEHFTFVRALGGLGDGPGDLPRSKGLAVDAQGTLWVVEGAFDVVQAFDGQGELIAVFGGRGTDDGHLWLPAGLAIGADGKLYVADTWNGRVQVFAVERARVRP